MLEDVILWYAGCAQADHCPLSRAVHVCRGEILLQGPSCLHEDGSKKVEMEARMGVPTSHCSKENNFPICYMHAILYCKWDLHVIM